MRCTSKRFWPYASHCSSSSAWLATRAPRRRLPSCARRRALHRDRIRNRMRIVGRLRDRVLGDRDAEPTRRARTRPGSTASPNSCRRLARRNPGKIGRESVGAGFGRAKRGDAPLREQGKRALGVRREKCRERLRASVLPMQENRLDREPGMELRRGADGGEHGVAVAETRAASPASRRYTRGVAVIVRSYGGIRAASSSASIGKTQPVDHARGAAAGRRHHRDAPGPGEVRRPATRQQRRDLDQRLEQSTRTMPQSRK